MIYEIDKGTRFLQQHDPVLRKIIKKIGPCTLKPQQDYFLSLVQSIMYQQLSLKAAGTIYERFQKKAKKITPQRILQLHDEDFQQTGVSRQKRRYLRDLAEKFQSKIINTSQLHTLSDDELTTTLIQVKGIGRWTAEMFLIFSLNRLNILPVDDLGFQRAIYVNYQLRIKPSKQRIEKLAKPWEPYRTLATWYLWKSLEGNTSGWD